MRSCRSSMRHLVGVALSVCLTWITAFAQSNQTNLSSPEPMKQLGQYPLNDFGEVFLRLQKEVALPRPRPESRLLPLLPKSTAFYAAFPNYGNAAQQALKIFREERQARPALGNWWQSLGLEKTGPQFEMAIEAVSQLSQYLGDEIVVSGSLNGSSPPSMMMLAEVRKPGLKQAIDFAIQLASGTSKPAVRVLDESGLAGATEGIPRQFTILVRPDFVVAGSDLQTLRNFSRQLDLKKREFPATEFGRRIQQGYKGGVAVVAGVDLQAILEQGVIPPQQSQILEQTGFADMKYVVWEHRGLPGQPSSEGELSFTHPRHSLASWIAAPRDLRSLEFASPNAILVATIALKNLGSIFDDVQTLASTSNPRSLAQLDQIEQGLGINLKEDLLSQFGGEITVELDDAAQDQPAWQAFLEVNDAQRVEQTLGKLLALAPVQQQLSTENGITYHTVTVHSPTKAIEIGYAFNGGYLVIGSTRDKVRDAVRLHREGGSLGKSAAFLASLPPGHSTHASALYYQDPLRLMGLQLSRLAPELGNAISHGSTSRNPVVTCAYADETAIRAVSMSQAIDVSTVLIAAAVAIPNLVRAKNSQNEASAIGSMRSIVTAQTAYSSAYPARGFARDLASLGADPSSPGNYTPKHAGLLDMSLAKAECKAGAWCEKSGYNFTFEPTCPKLLCQEFVAIATPVSAATGARTFCATSEGVIRYRMITATSAPITAKECKQWEPVE